MLIDHAWQSLKGRMYTTQGLPTADDRWDMWMNNPGQGTAEEALSSLRQVFAVMNYMRAIQANRQLYFDARRAASEVFDDLYGRVCTFAPCPLQDVRQCD